MKKFLSLAMVSGLLMTSAAFAQVVKEPPTPIRDPKSPLREDDAPVASISQIEREIALVRLAELNNEIALAKLAYTNSENEKVRQFASRLEAVYTTSRDRLARIARAPAPVVVRAEKVALPPIAEPEPRAETGKPDPGTTPRKDSGSSDPSIGSKPDAGNLDEYNRNSTNSKADSDEDRAQLRRALKEQSTPGGLEKKRDVEKKAADAPVTEIREPRTINPWVSIQQKIAAQRLKNARAVLIDKTGPEFDIGYLRRLIATHQAMIDADEVYATYLPSDSPLAIEADIQRSNAYLQEAAELLK